MIKIENRQIFSDRGLMVRRIGSESAFSRAIALSTDTTDLFEEVDPATMPRYTRADYEQRVEAKIRQRYTVAAELATLRQRDTKPDEYATYYAYAEACKAEARAELEPETASNI